MTCGNAGPCRPTFALLAAIAMLAGPQPVEVHATREGPLPYDETLQAVASAALVVTDRVPAHVDPVGKFALLESGGLSGLAEPVVDREPRHGVALVHQGGHASKIGHKWGGVQEA